MGMSITATGKAIGCCHPITRTSLTGSESSGPMSSRGAQAPQRRLLPGEARTSGKGPAEAGWKAGWMHRAGKEQATRGGRQGWRAARWVWGALCCKETLEKAGSTMPSSLWNRPHPLDIPGTAPCYWAPAWDVSPESLSRAEESHCGATCLHPPREC